MREAELLCSCSVPTCSGKFHEEVEAAREQSHTAAAQKDPKRFNLRRQEQDEADDRDCDGDGIRQGVLAEGDSRGEQKA